MDRPGRSTNQRVTILHSFTIHFISFLFLIALASYCHGATHYISISTGSDTNTGTTKTAAWAHLPGMATCTGNCKSYNPVAGDVFILKGCDIWTNSTLPILWNWSGSAGNVISVSYDPTWYNSSNCPSAWNRAVLDAGKANISGGNNFITLCYSGNCQYTTFESIEMKGLYSAGAGSYGNLNYVACYESCTNIILNNLYLHGWNVVTDGNCMLVLGSTNSPYASGSSFNNGIIDGSDATGASPAGATCYAFYGWPSVTNSVIHDVANGILPLGGGTISGNLIYNIKPSNAGVHENGIETLGGGGTYYIHDNVIHDNVGETFMFGNTNETDYIWNNVFYNLSNANPLHFPQGSGMSNMNTYIWNNTVDAAANNCFLWVTGFGGSWNNFTLVNNHCITSAMLYNSGFTVVSLTVSNNPVQTESQANSQGYTAAQSYAYSPTSPSGITVSAGKNLTTDCSGNISGLCSDTAYAISYNSATETLTTPGRTSNARPLTGAWDAGAYLWAQDPPSPPTNLIAMPN